jgi:hypothetical protein
MPFPETTRLELPILQELKASGGGDQLRYLYDRLTPYFPQLTPQDLSERSEAGRSHWHLAVQRAGRQLEELGELRRSRARWSITPRGLKRVEAEALRLEPGQTQVVARTLTHKEAQALLVELGLLLGRHAEAKFEHYDVVWRESATAPRLSHVFEVQIAGSVDSALTRLKQAYDTQRSRPFLVLADERDQGFAGKRLSGPFHEIWQVVTVIGVGELQRFYEAVKPQAALLQKLLERR